MATNETSAGPRAARGPHAVTGAALTFDLAAEAAALVEEPTWRARGHNAKTLVKHPDFRVVLIALRAGARMSEHKTDHCVTIHALEGRLRLHVPTGPALELGQGELLALEQTMLHDIEALADSVFLLSLGWSATPSAKI
jgi:quercetin dioxygenase-like cupin family protein